jgi:two-component system chemotaxis response regulator CheY
MRADERLRAIPAVMISTEAEAQDGEKAYAAGANVYLIKPVRPDQLLALSRLMLGIAGA